ncbi:MAG: N-acetylglucosamine-6-phosphate deacetylase [Cytophagaceae bacterium SCN 52-12]|nr:MAG: N-acetylglucosamine-6-phosphate deacetylase [Cytophagaceae bacterium SCN 52-12]
MPFVLAKKIFTGGSGQENCLIGVEEGTIVSVIPVKDTGQVPEEAVVFDNLAPGFIDIHINGGVEHHFTQNPTVEALWDMLSASRETGTPFILPTCITSPWENIREAIASTRSFMNEFPDAGILGLHLEGPFINPKKRGAHLESFILKPADELLQSLKEEGKGVLKLLTLAPEYFTPDQLRGLIEAGIMLSAGHSNASFAEARQAFENNVDLCTHLFNAMSAFGHREPGLVGAVFESENVYAPIILDGIHCDYAAARIAYRQKKEKLLLISDALFLGRQKARFRWGEFDAVLEGDRYVNSEGNLAGGAISLPEAVVNAVREVGIPLAEAVEMATLRPAAALGLEDKLGKVAVGYPAVFTVFSDDLASFRSVSF